jgi:hypothetical protein
MGSVDQQAVRCDLCGDVAEGGSWTFPPPVTCGDCAAYLAFLVIEDLLPCC